MLGIITLSVIMLNGAKKSVCYSECRCVVKSIIAEAPNIYHKMYKYFNSQVADRPITQQGLTGIRTAAGTSSGQRQVTPVPQMSNDTTTILGNGSIHLSMNYSVLNETKLNEQ